MTAGLNDAADIFDEASASLDTIEPPEDVADPHQLMVEKTASGATEIREFADTIANANLQELTERLPEFQDIAEFGELEQAVDDIQAAGYDIGGSGSSSSPRRVWRNGARRQGALGVALQGRRSPRTD